MKDLGHYETSLWVPIVGLLVLSLEAFHSYLTLFLWTENFVLSSLALSFWTLFFFLFSFLKMFQVTLWLRRWYPEASILAA